MGEIVITTWSDSIPFQLHKGLRGKHGRYRRNRRTGASLGIREGFSEHLSWELEKASEEQSGSVSKSRRNAQEPWVGDKSVKFEKATKDMGPKMWEGTGSF